jgi:hypothetical protein
MSEAFDLDTEEGIFKASRLPQVNALHSDLPALYNKAFLIHGNAKHDPEKKENEVSVNTGVFPGIRVAKS